MIRPALIFSALLVFFSGLELFGRALVLGNQNGFNMLAVYLYKLTSRLGLPAYHLMAGVAVCMILLTFPLVFMQRYFLRSADRYAALRGKHGRQNAIRLGKWKYLILAFVVAWLFVTVFVPLSGIMMRAFVTHWGVNVKLLDVITLENVINVFSEPVLLRGIRNSVLIGTIGGALAVVCYTAIAFAAHRRNDVWTHLLDYVILIPRAVPGLLIGLAFLWVFIFVVPMRPLRPPLVSLWLAYPIV